MNKFTKEQLLYMLKNNICFDESATSRLIEVLENDDKTIDNLSAKIECLWNDYVEVCDDLVSIECNLTESNEKIKELELEIIIKNEQIIELHNIFHNNAKEISKYIGKYLGKYTNKKTP